MWVTAGYRSHRSTAALGLLLDGLTSGDVGSGLVLGLLLLGSNVVVAFAWIILVMLLNNP